MTYNDEFTNLSARILGNDPTLTITDYEAYNAGYEDTDKYLEDKGQSCPECGSDKYGHDGDTFICNECFHCEV